MTEKQDAYMHTAGIPKQSTGYLFAKRIFDFVFSFCVSILLILPLAVLAVLVMIKDPGTPFYVQKRVGQDDKELKVAKLRSMRKGADRLEEMLHPEQLEQYKKEYKLDDDPRLIGYQSPGDGKKCFGGIIRRTSLDELDENYTPEERKLLLSVKPGLTGYWKAYGRKDANYETRKRQKMELYYAENASFWLDLKITFATVAAGFFQYGAK